MEYLKTLKCWCNWSFEQRLDSKGELAFKKDGTPDMTKVPHGKYRENASSSSTSTWIDFKTATEYFAAGGFDGLGFFFFRHPSAPLLLCGIDIDAHGEGGENPLAATLEETFKGTYMEKSPSGKGTHIIMWVKPEAVKDYKKRWFQKNSNIEVECYVGGVTNRYFTYTGNAINHGVRITDQTEKLVQFLEENMRRDAPKEKKTVKRASKVKTDLKTAKASGAALGELHEAHSEEAATGNSRLDSILDRARRSARYGREFRTLFDEGDVSKYQSDGSNKQFENEADLRLCTLLEYFLDGDPELMDAAFRASSLMRPKWDESRGGKTYGEMTIEKAVNEAGGAHFSTDRRPNDYSDSGNAEKFVEVYGDRVLFTPALGWYVFDGITWVSSDHTVRALTMQFAEEMRLDAIEMHTQSMREADDSKPSEAAKAYLRHATKLRNADKQSAMLKQAAALVYHQTDELDAHPYILNTPIGAWDLASCALLPPEEYAALYSTRITRNVPRRTEEGAKLWERFLLQICEGEHEAVDYLQTYIGMCAIGKVTQEKLLVAVGDGANGKSTFFNALASVLGDYAGTIDADILIQSPKGMGNFKSDIAGLRGKRLIVCGEIEKGSRLSESALKRLCSTDMIRVELKYHEGEDVRPTHHICLFCNNLPTVPSNDHSVQRRLAALEFNAHFAKSECIPNFADVLAEKAGDDILLWVCEGAKRFIDGGMKLPEERTSRAIAQWMNADEWLRDFIDDTCITSPNESELLVNLYGEYEKYCRMRRLTIRRRKEFERALAGMIDDDGKQIFCFQTDSHTKKKRVWGLMVNAVMR